MPVPSVELSDDTDKTAPLCPVGPPVPRKSISPVRSSRLLPRSNGIALKTSFSDHT